MNIIKTAKEITDLALKGATVDLQERVLQFREEALTMQEENLTLRTRVKKLEEALTIQQELKFDGSVYWRLTDGDKHGPYCQRCYDVDKKIVQLQRNMDEEQHVGWGCSACKSFFDLYGGREV